MDYITIKRTRFNEFFNAEIPDLRHIAALVGAKGVS